MHKGVINVDNQKIPAVSGYRNGKEHTGTEPDTIAQHNTPRTHAGKPQEDIQARQCDARLKQTEARKPEDTLEEDVIQQAVRVAEIFSLHKQRHKIGDT